MSVTMHDNMSTKPSGVNRVSSRSWLVAAGLLLVAGVMLAQLTTVAADATSPATTVRSQVSDEALEKALSDKRYLMRQLKCALGEVPCDPVGKRLKSLAPFVLRGACPQCTPVETTQIKKTLAHLQRNFPAEWNKLIQTYAG
ncbi:putative odorant-binding protein A10 [Anopheles bellator]|uniref:putative odorant-binding protein A10 n=1 Tax=Anopheles bellator TaxID=139047 RepID=UPI002649A440|nr:putative odorant-binding protein A10 [Anopheles bellator]